MALEGGVEELAGLPLLGARAATNMGEATGSESAALTSDNSVRPSSNSQSAALSPAVRALRLDESEN